MRNDLHARWYPRLLFLWVFTGLPLLILANFHSPNWFSIIPGAPPLSEGIYPTVAWFASVIIIWQPVLLLPFWVWSKRRGTSKVDNA